MLEITELSMLEISVALVAVLCLWLLARRRQAPASFPKVPGWPLLGSLIELGSVSRLYEQLGAWAKAHGKAEGAYEFRLPGVVYVVVCKHALGTELLAHRPFKLRRPAHLRETVLPFDLFNPNPDPDPNPNPNPNPNPSPSPSPIPNQVPFEGLFFAEGDQWRLDKRVVGPAFSHKHLEEYLHPIRRIAERLLEVLAAANPKTLPLPLPLTLILTLTRSSLPRTARRSRSTARFTVRRQTSPP